MRSPLSWVVMFARRTEWKLTPNRFTEAQRAAVESGREIFDLTVSNPTSAGFAYDADFILGELTNPQSLTYQPHPKGRYETREAIAAYFGQHEEVHFDPE